MSAMPNRPFLTESFSPRGGGIDFLGMRQVNLHILQEFLIPGINNATSDFGTYCLATWIPWKFRQLSTENDFTLSRYRKYREAVEIAIAFAMRTDSSANERFGSPRLRIGVQQVVDLSKPLTFKAAKRTDATSLFAAPLYGPSLRYLNLIAGDAVAVDGTSTGIPLAARDEATEILVNAVESSLRACRESESFQRVDVPPLSAEALDRLGLHGFHPAYYRDVGDDVKRSFLRKFLMPQRRGDQADYRRLTAWLICETVRQHEFHDPDELRACWYTGLLPSGAPLKLATRELVLHRERWALFHARQVQRTFAELFLRCFEIGLGDGAQSIREVVDSWRDRSPDEFTLERRETLGQLIRQQAAPISQASDFDELSADWHAEVHGEHPQYDDIPEDELDGELWRAMRMLARWWVRMQQWLHSAEHPEFLALGGYERMSMRWFAEWIDSRQTQTLPAVIEALFSEVVFSQHVKVALARFDGQVQRLRFTLGDSGIIPTTAGRDKLGLPPVRMADRLSAFLGLLDDVDVIRWTDGEPFEPGPFADFAAWSGGAC